MGVGMGHRCQHGIKQRQPRCHRQAVRIAVAVNALALHQLQHQIRLAAVADAGVQQVGDVRVREARQDLALAAKALRPGAADQRQVQQLDGHRCVEAAVFAPRPPHAATTTLADGCLQQVGAQALAGQAGLGQCRHAGMHGIRRCSAQKTTRLGLPAVGQQRRQRVGQRR